MSKRYWMAPGAPVAIREDGDGGGCFAGSITEVTRAPDSIGGGVLVTMQVPFTSEGVDMLMRLVAEGGE